MPHPSLGARMFLTALPLSFASAIPALAQSTGTITGSVVHAETDRPLSGAQVMVSGTTIGTLSRTDGRFVRRGIPEER